MTQTPPPHPPAAWYVDPTDPGKLRYWDGEAWTTHTAENTTPPPPPSSVPAAGTDAAPAVPGIGPTGTAYASFGRRLVGLVIDGILLSIPVAILAAVRLGPAISKFSTQLEALGPTPDPAAVNRLTEDLVASLSVETLLGIALVTAGINLIYYGVCLHLWGRTLGGQLLGIRCVTADGTWPSWRQSFTRAAIPVGFNLVGSIPGIGFIGSALLLVNYLSMIWHPKRQCWMDRAAGTYVVRAR